MLHCLAQAKALNLCAWGNAAKSPPLGRCTLLASVKHLAVLRGVFRAMVLVMHSRLRCINRSVAYSKKKQNRFQDTVLRNQPTNAQYSSSSISHATSGPQIIKKTHTVRYIDACCRRDAPSYIDKHLRPVMSALKNNSAMDVHTEHACFRCGGSALSPIIIV